MDSHTQDSTPSTREARRESLAHLFVPGGEHEQARERLEALRRGEIGGAPLDLSGMRLVNEDLSRLSLERANLAGADLSRADLSEANLFAANLRGATLVETDLSHAELTGADLTGAHLEGAILKQAGLGMADLRGAQLARADLRGATMTEASLADADVRVANLEGARMRQSDLRGADFTKSCLQHAELEGAHVEGAVFDTADLRGVGLARLEGYRKASWLGVDIREIDFSRAYMCRNYIMDQNFIEEFRNQSRWSEAVYVVWRVTSDCGRSIGRWALFTVLLMLLFACAFTLVGVDYGTHGGPVASLYFSVVTFTTLGYGDIVPATTAAQILAMVEVTSGYVMLGGLLSILSNKMASRANG